MELTPLAVLRCHLQIFGLPSKQKVGRSTIFLDPNCKQTADFVYIFKKCKQKTCFKCQVLKWLWNQTIWRKKWNIFLELTVMSLDRLTSSGFGTKNSQITRPPRAIIVPGTMKEYDQSSSTQTAEKFSWNQILSLTSSIYTVRKFQ